MMKRNEAKDKIVLDHLNGTKMGKELKFRRLKHRGDPEKVGNIHGIIRYGVYLQIHHRNEQISRIGWRASDGYVVNFRNFISQNTLETIMDTRLLTQLFTPMVLRKLTQIEKISQINPFISLPVSKPNCHDSSAMHRMHLEFLGYFSIRLIVTRLKTKINKGQIKITPPPELDNDKELPSPFKTNNDV